MSNLNFDVFLSHNSDDKPDVIKLANRLKEHGIEPWLDAWQLVPGENWGPAIEQALRSCRACLVLVGPRGLGNVHEDEMWAALQHESESKRADRRFQVIPVLLPKSTRGDRSRLPILLTKKTWVEFSQSMDEPAAFHKLLATIRGEARGVGLTLSKTECPYRGLAYFDVQHAPLFFGREVLTDWLLAHLKGSVSKDGPTRFLAIVGASGSGKSSLARAGLLAKLKSGELPGSQHWPIVICRPEHRPLESLATALANTDGVQLGSGLKGTLIRQLTEHMDSSAEQLHLVAQGAMPANDPDWRLVVFVDQFEELFTLNVRKVEAQLASVVPSQLSSDRHAFVNNLLYAASIPGGRVVVVLTMRADFYGKCASLPELATALSQHQELVGPMSPTELRDAIEHPAALSGYEVETGLVDQLVSEVAGEPGALPLLQYALAELWKKSSKLGHTKLGATEYRDLGGWKGALTNRADQVFAEFNGKPEGELFRQLFLRLVQPGEGTEDTKRLVRWDELRREGEGEAVAWKNLVEKLADADHRLITTDDEALRAESTVEVVHEALIRNWPLLRAWLDADRESLRMHHKLTKEAKAWHPTVTAIHRRGDESLLFIGNRLTTFDEWASNHWSELSSPEKAFIAACRDLKNEKDEKTRRDEEQRRLQKERMLKIATMASIAFVLLIAGFWFNSRQISENAMRQRADDLVNELIQEPTQIRTKISRLNATGLRPWADRILQDKTHNIPKPDSEHDDQDLCARLLLLNEDSGQAEFLFKLLRPGKFPLGETTEEQDKKAAFFSEICWILAEFAPEGAALEELRQLKSESLTEVIEIDSVSDQNIIRVRRGQRRAAVAIALLRNRNPARLEALQIDDDPEAITQMCAHCKKCKVTASDLFDALECERKRLATMGKGSSDQDDLTPASGTTLERQRAALPRFSLLMALGEYKLSDLPPKEAELLKEYLQNWFEKDSSSAIHGVTGWLMRRWGNGQAADDIERRISVERVPTKLDKEWFVIKVDSNNNKSAIFTFIVFEPGKTELGSTVFGHFAERQIPRQVEITRKFAICDREVTCQQFDLSDLVEASKPILSNVPKDIPWNASVKYCNWLTAKLYPDHLNENCYIEEGDELFPVKDSFFMKAGFRLPTDAEWEYACRSGTRTTYSFGSDPSLLNNYGSPSEGEYLGPGDTVGQFRPNLRGLFDLHGGALEWCNDRWLERVDSLNGKDPFFDVQKDNRNSRVLRGGIWKHRADATSSARYWQGNSGTYGMRLALTLDVSPGGNEK